MFNYILQLNLWLQNAASVIAVANVLLQKFAINKMQCIVAIHNFFDNTNGDTINYDSVVLCRTLCRISFAVAETCYVKICLIIVTKNSYSEYLVWESYTRGNLCQCHSHTIFKAISMLITIMIMLIQRYWQIEMIFVFLVFGRLVIKALSCS